jgi:hypothetical protein
VCEVYIHATGCLYTIFQISCPDANKAIVKNNSPRTCLRKELEEVREPKRFGARAGADDTYHLNLWYFSGLLFLEAQETRLQC